MAKYTVALRGGFADRNRIREENKVIQKNTFDMRTRIALINATDTIIHSYYSNIDISHRNIRHEGQEFIRNLLADVYCQVVDCSCGIRYSEFFSIVKETIASDDYAAVLTILEYITQETLRRKYMNVVYKEKKYSAEQLYNLVLEQEYVGYRFINGEARPITDDTEIRAIREASDSKHAEVKQHIDKALGFLSDRESPDYANSIKESISAVERMCSLIIGKETTLGKALKHLEDSGVKIHSALKEAFNKLYGYTSDASGIRHAGELGGAESTFEEAKFMLVSCCAFVNYLTGVMAKHP